MTACFVCLSQAPDNLTQSKYALMFGEIFSQLNWQSPVPVKPEKVEGHLKAEAEKLLASANAALEKKNVGNFGAMRLAQKRDSEQLLGILAMLRTYGD